MTLLGLDLSKWNGAWNASKAKEAGVVYVFIKASQAVHMDPRFEEHWKKAKDAGLLRGAYHYLDYTEPAATQADYFIDAIAADPGELPSVVDYEEKRTDGDYNLCRSYLRDFLKQLQSRGVKPMIYTSRGFWTKYGDTSESWLQYPLWLANWLNTESPALPSPWTKWAFWQYTSDGDGQSVGTESARVDMNRFAGSLDELKSFAATYRPVIASQAPVPAQTEEDRIGALEHLLSNLEPVITEAFTGLEERVLALESGGVTGEGGGSLPAYELRISALDQKVNSASVQGAALAEQVAAINQQLTAIKQFITALPQAVPASLATIEQRLAVLEQQIPAAQSAPAQGGAPASNGTYAICNVRGLNVRKGPGLGYPIVAGLDYGQRVKVLGREGGWAQLESPAGWSAEMYLTFS
ncbi:MAG: hypothetical protein FJZ96_05040 [Chloroflexi bacterium]|nr:hypothetical protein [Chloroflexota bacterium]